MTYIKMPKKLLCMLMAALIVLTSFSAIEFGSITAYAASLSKPSVTLTNVSPTSIKISWKKVSGASKYTVYRSLKKASGFKAIKSTTSNSLTNSSLTCGKTYYYKVKAVKGKASATSKVVSKKAAPAKASPKTSSTCSTIKVSWKKLSGVSGYQVYYSTSKSGKYKRLTSTKSTSYTQKKIKLGATRYYKVRAYKKVGKSYVYGAFSPVVSKKTAHAASTAWTITKKATCNATGTKTNKCKYCNKKYSAVIPKDNSNHKYIRTTKPATKTSESYYVYTCQRCGYKYNSKIKQHSYKETVTAPSCTEKGYTTYTCESCGYSYIGNYTDVTEHKYETKSYAANCVDDGYNISVCTVCGYADESTKVITQPSANTQHIFETKTFEPTCITEGCTVSVCSVCGYIDKTTRADIVAPLDHSYPDEYTTDESNYRHYSCSRCDYTKIDKTCYIDLTNKTVSIPAVAVFSKSATSNLDKLDLNTDGISDYEITGTAENLTIDVNATTDVDIKLAGAVITNNNMDCIDVKDKSEDESLQSTDTVIVEDIIPKVSISAKDTTESFLTVTGTGNAIDNSCELSMKGHGKLTMNTAATTIDCKGKLSIKNLTMDITSGNRGIDTKLENKNEAGLIINTDYFNIKIADNANVTINSADDCIRCKNMEFEVLTEGNNDTVMNLTSTAGDGIQLEGKKGLTMHSGIVTIKAGKNPLNNKSGIAPIIDGTAQLNI